MPVALPDIVLAAIIKTAGNVALTMATTPELDGETIQPSQIASEFENHYKFAFNCVLNHTMAFLEPVKSEKLPPRVTHPK